MAKRKRLTPPTPEAAAQAAPETKSGFPSYPMGVAPGPSPRRAPIADVAGAAAAAAALSEVSAVLEAARAEGRLVQSLPLDVVDAGHLARDRLTGAVPDEDMQSLVSSLRARGQQTPIEVVQTGKNSFGLISGWRRLSALRRLHSETGEARFANVSALVRRPETAADAYVAMVEENEIRAGLSYFERAQIVSRTVAGGIYPDQKKALNSLFGSASRAKRSKIKSFIPLVEDLGAALRFPTAIGERLGLRLAARLGEPGFAARLTSRLAEAAPDTAEAELALLRHAASGADLTERAGAVAGKAAASRECPSPAGDEVAPGLWLRRDRDGLHVSGPGLTDAVEAHLRAALKG